MRTRGEGTYSFNENEQLFTWKLRVDGRNVIRKAKTQKELKAKVRAALTEVDSRGGALSKADRLATVAGFLNDWLANVIQPNRAPGTYRQYSQLVRLYIIPGIGQRTLQELRPAHVQVMLNDLRQPSGDRRALQPQSINLVRSTLSRALAGAVLQRIIAVNPSQATERPKLSPGERRALNADQTAALLKVLAASPSRYAPILRVMIATGLRTTEATGLTWSNYLQSPAPVLQIRKRLETLGDIDWVLAPLKTAKSRRDIPLNTDGQDALKLQAAICERDRSALADLYPDHDLMFTTSTGQPLDYRNVQRALDTALKAAGLQHFCLRDLRRTFGTRLANQRVPPNVLQSLMGHENIVTTLTHYVVTFDDAMLAAVMGTNT